MILFSTLLFFCALQFSTAIIPLNFSQQLTDAEVLEKWNKIDKEINRLLQSAVKSIMPYVAGSEIQLSSKCMNDGLRVLLGLRKAQPWALRFLDSSGKIMSGILTGTISDFGSYEECVDTVLKDNKDEIIIKGQYCNIHLRPPMPTADPNVKIGDIPPLLKNISEKSPLMKEIAKYSSSFNFMSLRLGICVPSGCETEDVGKILKYLGDMINFDTYVSRCEVKEELKFSKEEIVSFTIVSIFAALMIVGTLTDIYSTKMNVTFNNKAGRLLLVFSLPRNVKKLLKTQNSSGPFSCLHGIRFITTLWIVFSHSYYVLNYYALTGLLKTMTIGKDIAFQIVMNGTFAVETFVCIGGLLVSYHIVSQNRRSINIPYYILHRIWRVLPMVAITIICFFMTFHLSYGPIWRESFISYAGDCENNWWSNLIFINNFYRTEDSCLPHTWYIASDMQMYIAALIIYLPLLKRPKVGLTIAFLAILASIIYCGVHTYVNDLPPTMLTVQPNP
ncbi:nose resistant to fluoxetine protein 6-like, partial [Stegodyphus dumicola]|uniref:nose resistant to fluoxetine protein 6-like n=1 Tax=Stegodyphus dumicola TaxID=202533 RepID=UPI0015A91899